MSRRLTRMEHPTVFLSWTCITHTLVLLYNIFSHLSIDFDNFLSQLTFYHLQTLGFYFILGPRNICTMPLTKGNLQHAAARMQAISVARCAFVSVRASIFHHSHKLAFGSDNVLGGGNSRSPQNESFAMTQEICLHPDVSYSRLLPGHTLLSNRKIYATVFIR